MDAKTFYKATGPNGKEVGQFKASSFLDFRNVGITDKDGLVGDVSAFVPYCRMGCGETLTPYESHVYSTHHKALLHLNVRYNCEECGCVYEVTTQNGTSPESPPVIDV